MLACLRITNNFMRFIPRILSNAKTHYMKYAFNPEQNRSLNFYTRGINLEIFPYVFYVLLIDPKSITVSDGKILNDYFYGLMQLMEKYFMTQLRLIQYSHKTR